MGVAFVGVSANWSNVESQLGGRFSFPGVKPVSVDPIPDVFSELCELYPVSGAAALQNHSDLGFKLRTHLSEALYPDVSTVCKHLLVTFRHMSVLLLSKEPFCSIWHQITFA